MPLTYTDPVAGYSDASFSALEKERIRDILQLDAFSSLDTPIAELTADQRKATRYDIDLWINDIGEGTVAVQGASDGVDYSQPRDRGDIRRRMALRFGFPVPMGAGGIFRIPVVSEYGYVCYEDY